MYQAHVLGPAARRGAVGVFAEAARGGRPVAWTAIAVVALTGFYNVTRLGPLQQRRVRERPDVDGPKPHRAPELGDRVLRRLIAAEEEVAVDRLVGLGKLVGGNVMERGDHLRAGQKRLSLFGG